MANLLPLRRMSSFSKYSGIHIPQRYFNETFPSLEVLRISSSISELGGMVWMQLGALFITWVIIYLCLVRGIQSVKLWLLFYYYFYFFNLSQFTFAGRQGCVLYSSISVFAVDHIVCTRSHPTGRFERHQIFHLSRVASPARPQGLGRCGYPDVLWPRTRLGWPCEYVQLQ